MAIDVIKELLERWDKKRVAVLVDEVFQVIGLEKAGLYVKSLLTLIEYPPRSYEGIVAVVATSEGLLGGDWPSQVVYNYADVEHAEGGFRTTL